MASIVDPASDGKTHSPDLLERVARALFDEWNERLMDGSFTWDPRGVIAENMRREAAVVLRWAVVRDAVARGLGVDL